VRGWFMQGQFVRGLFIQDKFLSLKYERMVGARDATKFTI